MAETQQDYQTLQARLDEVLAKLQGPDVHVDEAVVLYQEGLRLIAKIEAHLTKAHNKIEQLKLQHKGE